LSTTFHRQFSIILDKIARKKSDLTCAMHGKKAISRVQKKMETI